MSYLRGDFALCLYDLQCGLFIVIRDRYSIKPLFRMIIDGELLMTAEMKAFLPLGGSQNGTSIVSLTAFNLNLKKYLRMCKGRYSGKFSS